MSTLKNLSIKTCQGFDFYPFGEVVYYHYDKFFMGSID